MCEKDLAQNDWDGYFWMTEKAGLNSLSVAFEDLVESVQQHRQHPMASRLGFPDVHLVHALQQEIAA